LQEDKSVLLAKRRLRTVSLVASRYVIAIIGVVFALLLSAVQKARESAQSIFCAKNL
jgi:hypothetical protein